MSDKITIGFDSAVPRISGLIDMVCGRIYFREVVKVGLPEGTPRPWSEGQGIATWRARPVPSRRSKGHVQRPRGRHKLALSEEKNKAIVSGRESLPRAMSG